MGMKPTNKVSRILEFHSIEYQNNKGFKRN